MTHSGSGQGHHVHEGHEHRHGTNCGHRLIEHDGHTDYLHDGCMHHLHDGHVDEHRLEVGGRNPARCTPEHECGRHDDVHQHGDECTHPAVPHGDHLDYVVEGHLHHPHGDHCDDHGPVDVR